MTISTNQYLNILTVTDTATDASVYTVPKGLGIIYGFQQTITTANASATLTIAQLLTQIIQTTSTTAVTFTLPTGTLSDAGIQGGTSAVGTCFDFSIINTGSSSGAITVSGGTGNTLVGSGAIAISTTGRFRAVKTATNTFSTYRVG